MRRFGEEAQESGRILSNETIKATRDAEIALQQMSGEISGNLNQALLALMPLLLSASSKIAGLTTSVRGFFDSMSSARAADDIENTLDQLKLLDDQIALFEAGSPDSVIPINALGGIELARERVEKLRADLEHFLQRPLQLAKLLKS